MVRLLSRVLLWSFAVVGMIAFAAVAVVIFEHGDSGCSPEGSARAQLRQLSNALQLYEIDTGQYPTTDQGLLALISKPDRAPRPENYPSGGYIKKPSLLADPWGDAYRYYSDGESFVVFSVCDSGCLFEYVARLNTPLQRKSQHPSQIAGGTMAEP